MKYLRLLMVVALTSLLFMVIPAAADAATVCVKDVTVRIDWTYPAERPADFLEFRVYRSTTGPDGAYERIPTEDKILDTFFIDTTLLPGEYPLHYVVSAADCADNESEWSLPSTPDIFYNTIPPPGIEGAPTVTVVPGS